MKESKGKLAKILDAAPQWGVSLLVHALILGMLALFYIDTHHKPNIATVVSTLDELSPDQVFPEELMQDEEIQLDAPVALQPTSSAGSIAGAQASVNPLETAARTEAATQAIASRRDFRPLTGAVGALELGSNISGLKGVTLNAGGGDAGVLDRISSEIIAQLGKNKVLVAWIMDSSASLDERREAIAERFDRIYRELDELGVNENDALLTTVVAAGQSAKFLIEKPTNDLRTIRKAIRAIKDDRTGVENLFAAVRETALRFRRYQTAGRRTLMMILLTDEIGDDESRIADEAVELLKRNGVPLYVMGPEASFARPIVHDVWPDPDSRFRIWIPIKRGPYTREEEVLHVPFLYNSYSSGFGPFALTRITRETGGVFFLYDDDRVYVKTKYDPEILIRYKANYGTEREYQQEVVESPFRRTLMELSRESNNNRSYHHFNGHHWHWFHAKALLPELERRPNDIARWIEFANRAIEKFEQIEPEYDHEPDLRWRANFDLNYARLLLSKVRADEYNWSCADLKTDPPTLDDPIKNNGWKLRFVEKINVGRRPGESEKSANGESASKNDRGGAGARLAQAEKDLLEKSLFHFQRVIDQHPGTPWELAAKRERSRSVGCEWIEGFDRDYAFSDEERAQLRRAGENAPRK